MRSQVDEPICLSEPSRSWVETFASERTRIRRLLPLPVEHIGSTAVPDLPAKPIVDIQLGAPVYPVPLDTVHALERLGYENLGESGVPGRLYFRRRGPQSFNVHIVRFGGDHWTNNIALREYLRTSASARNIYANAKREAISRGASSLLAYSAAKADVVASLLMQARAPEMSGNKSLERTLGG
jgi:GrpB-like predicted nucleotidyltransferase (UPF0157 family)